MDPTETPQTTFFKMIACVEVFKRTAVLDNVSFVKDSPYFPVARSFMLDSMMGCVLRGTKDQVEVV